jgi:hypothetical protein
MKTMKVLSAISLALVLTAGAIFANPTVDPVSNDRQKLITYEVKVNFAPNFAGAPCHFKIGITDKTGRLVVAAQLYHPGTTTYTFKEAANLVNGTRVAVMVPYPANQSGWMIPPSAKSGYFFGGSTYHYSLTPVQIVPVGGGGGK